jgi:hypothetical protein
VLAEQLDVLDNCRISWGQVQDVADASLEVLVRPLAFIDGRLGLGKPELRRVTSAIDGQGFVPDAGLGDWVSIHWGWVCDVLSPRQVENLHRYTTRHLAIANETL